MRGFRVARIAGVDVFADVSGRVNFNKGAVTLRGAAGLDFDFGPFDAEMSFEVEISNTRPLSTDPLRSALCCEP